MLILTSEQQLQINDGLTIEALEVFWRLHPDLNFDVAVGGAKMLLNGGQVRTENLEKPGETSPDFVTATQKSTDEGTKTE